MENVNYLDDDDQDSHRDHIFRRRAVVGEPEQPRRQAQPDAQN
jgi:hypothetical protein